MAEHPWQAALAESAEGTLVRVRLNPRSSREGVEGLSGDRLTVRVNTPPVEGKANRALLKLLAKEIGVPFSTVEVVAGARSRNKTVLARGWFPGKRA